jgi:quinol monooxygenase YgiN
MVNVNVGLVVRIVAKEGKEEEVAAFLAGALPLAQAESFTPAWFALRVDRATFYIVDAFADDAARGKHLAGPIAAALMESAPRLLAEAPRIEQVSVLASKLPG